MPCHSRHVSKCLQMSPPQARGDMVTFPKPPAPQSPPRLRCSAGHCSRSPREREPLGANRENVRFCSAAFSSPARKRPKTLHFVAKRCMPAASEWHFWPIWHKKPVPNVALVTPQKSATFATFGAPHFYRPHALLLPPTYCLLLPAWQKWADYLSIHCYDWLHDSSWRPPIPDGRMA